MLEVIQRVRLSWTLWVVTVVLMEMVVDRWRWTVIRTCMVESTREEGSLEIDERETLAFLSVIWV